MFVDLNLPRSYFLGCVWAFASFKWGVTAFFYSLKTLRRLYRSGPGFERLHEENADSTAHVTAAGGPVNS